jgi:hypothetical protein
VIRYFQDIDQLFNNLGVAVPTDEAKIAKTTYYLNAETADLWESIIPAHGGMTWVTFKTAIKALYPGSDRSRLYSARDLDNTHNYASRGVFNQADLGAYCHDFKRNSNYLVLQNWIDEGACKRLFIQGFGNATRRCIENRLTFMLPNHHPDDLYPTDEVQKAAEFLLLVTSPNTPSSPSNISSGSVTTIIK